MPSVVQAYHPVQAKLHFGKQISPGNMPPSVAVDVSKPSDRLSTTQKAPTLKDYLQATIKLLKDLMAAFMQALAKILNPSAEPKADPAPVENAKPEPWRPEINRHTDTIDFVAVGDGGAGTAAQHQIARQMEKEFDRRPYTHAFMLGDLIYWEGDFIKLGAERYSDVYKTLMDKGVVFRNALGNHDKGHSHLLPEMLDFFKMPNEYYKTAIGNTRFYITDTNKFDAEQAKWLKHWLSQPTSDFKIVIGHHPLGEGYSSGAHRNDPNTQAMADQMLPILKEHKPALYLSGHEHHYERFDPTVKDGILYLVSGGGGHYNLHKFKEPIAEGSHKRISEYHFIRFTIDGNEMEFRVIDHEGRIIDAGLVTKQENGQIQVQELSEEELKTRDAKPRRIP